MKRNVFEIYCYVICAVFLLVASFAATNTVYNLVGLAFPRFTMDSDTSKIFETNDIFKISVLYKQYKQHIENMTDEQLTEFRKSMHKIILRKERLERTQQTAKYITMLLIDSLIFWVHLIMARKTRKSIESIIA